VLGVPGKAFRDSSGRPRKYLRPLGTYSLVLLL
jgi:hypothetical protein